VAYSGSGVACQGVLEVIGIWPKKWRMAVCMACMGVHLRDLEGMEACWSLAQCGTPLHGGGGHGRRCVEGLEGMARPYFLGGAWSLACEGM